MTHSPFLALAVALLIAPSALAQTTAAECPVTINNGRGLTEPNTGNHSNDARTLATSLWPDGAVTFKPGGPGCIDPDGTLGMKWPWWRGVEGPLTIEGRRLDGPAAPMRVSIRGTYGRAGFQPSGLMFPTPGCWQVTGRVGADSLAFVTRVIKIDAGPATTCAPLGIYDRTPPRP
jgi:hypothetical protein